MLVDNKWWTDIALQGLASSILGALVGAAVVVFALRHEQLRAIRAEVNSVAGRAVSEALWFNFAISNATTVKVIEERYWSEFSASLAQFRGLTSARWPTFSSTVNEAQVQLILRWSDVTVEDTEKRRADALSASIWLLQLMNRWLEEVPAPDSWWTRLKALRARRAMWDSQLEDALSAGLL